MHFNVWVIEGSSLLWYNANAEHISPNSWKWDAQHQRGEWNRPLVFQSFFKHWRNLFGTKIKEQWIRYFVWSFLQNKRIHIWSLLIQQRGKSEERMKDFQECWVPDSMIKLQKFTPVMSNFHSIVFLGRLSSIKLVIYLTTGTLSSSFRLSPFRWIQPFSKQSCSNLWRLFH